MNSENRDLKVIEIWGFNPFHGGAHRDFLEGWQKFSQHKWENYTMPSVHWKWRMRQAPVYFSKASPRDRKPDAIFCTSMFNLCEFKGLRSDLSEVPTIMYFHENQLTYPIKDESERDLHLAFSQFTAALSADKVLFNSSYHLDKYLKSFSDWLHRMPTPSLMSSFDELKEKCFVQYPGISPPMSQFIKKEHRALRLLWSARWEEDKNVKLFLQLLKKLESAEFNYELFITGASEEKVMIDLEKEKIPKDKIKYIGYASPEDFKKIQGICDVFISTAHHEYFGLSAMEAASMGCYLLLPNRCVYPELYRDASLKEGRVKFHDDQIETMFNALVFFSDQKLAGKLKSNELQKWAGEFSWENQAAQFDKWFSELFVV